MLMKKVIIFILTMVMLLSLSSPALATEIEIKAVADDTPIMPLATLSIDFTLLASGSYKCATDTYYIHDGDTILHITSCTWSPATSNVRIGFRNVDTGVLYGVTFKNGAIGEYKITTENLPAGEYDVFIKNSGTQSISGALQYWVE